MTDDDDREAFRAELFWSAPRSGDQLAKWIDDYKASVAAAWRAPLSATLRDLHEADPITAWIEVGCHCGPAYRRIVEDVPALAAVPFLGIDTNADAIAEAQIWNGSYPRAEWVRGSLLHGLTFLAPKVADVVYTSTCLASIAPADLQAAVAALWRLARRTLVLHEPRRDVRRAYFREWPHDYAAAVEAVGATAILVTTGD